MRGILSWLSNEDIEKDVARLIEAILFFSAWLAFSLVCVAGLWWFAQAVNYWMETHWGL